jgi:pimeloyl-ACP methyl ester carboxylesterase
MIEHALQFGPSGRLMGILTCPEGSEGRKPPVVHILFNAGVIYRIGPHRHNVRLARELARQGEWVLRFDLSGHGDSRAADGSQTPRAQAIEDLKAAMDHVGALTGASHFSLLGICSGAVYAYWTALDDTRVMGLFMMDGFWFKTRWTRPVHIFKRVHELGLSGLSAMLQRRLKAVDARQDSNAKAIAPPTLDDGGLANPPRDAFVAAMDKLVQRGAAVKFLYGGSVIEVFSYARQFRDAFGSEPWFDAVSCHYRPEIDHTLISKEAQRGFTEEVSSWLPAVAQAVRLRER